MHNQVENSDVHLVNITYSTANCIQHIFFCFSLLPYKQSLQHAFCLSKAICLHILNFWKRHSWTSLDNAYPFPALMLLHIMPLTFNLFPRNTARSLFLIMKSVGNNQRCSWLSSAVGRLLQTYCWIKLRKYNKISSTAAKQMLSMTLILSNKKSLYYHQWLIFSADCLNIFCLFSSVLTSCCKTCVLSFLRGICLTHQNACVILLHHSCLVRNNGINSIGICNRAFLFLKVSFLSHLPS